MEKKLNFFRRLRTVDQKIEVENCRLTLSSGRVGVWVSGCKSCFVDCLQQSKSQLRGGIR
jgi:hypothetical protein